MSLVIGSFQYTKHSDACPIRVPVRKNDSFIKTLTKSKSNIFVVFPKVCLRILCHYKSASLKRCNQLSVALCTDESGEVQGGSNMTGTDLCKQVTLCPGHI